MSNYKYKILFTGGGTGGSVSPLLAIAEEMRSLIESEEINFLWLGGRNGIEKEMVEKIGIPFKSISSGKFRRYFSLKNLTDIFLVMAGFFESIYYILKWRPGVILSAGSFVSVPVVWAGWLLKVPVIIHQQDVRPGLANKLMTPFCKIVTVTFEKSLNDYGKKARLIGNPIRKELSNKNQELSALRIKYNLKENLPTLLVLGGGTGAAGINQLIWDSLYKLTEFCQIIHATGKGKLGASLKKESKNYKGFEFLNIYQMSEVLNMADLVISRCGMSTLAELSYFGKATILIPMPDSHQEDNAKVFKDEEAALVFDQNQLTPDILSKTILELLSDDLLLNTLRKNIKSIIKIDTNKEMIGIVKDLLNKSINTRG